MAIRQHERRRDRIRDALAGDGHADVIDRNRDRRYPDAYPNATEVVGLITCAATGAQHPPRTEPNQSPSSICHEPTLVESLVKAPGAARDVRVIVCGREPCRR